MFNQGDMVQLQRNLPEHGLSAGDLGTVVTPSPALDLYTVEFIKGERIIEVAVDTADLKVFQAGDSASKEAKENAATRFVMDRLKDVFTNLDNYKIKESVDKNGIDSFIRQCAVLAGATGAVTGAWGPLSLLGMPVDLANNIVQQFRVTLAVIYHKTGKYQVSFDYFMRIVGISLGVEVGAMVGRYALVQIARQIVLRLSAGGVGRMIPVVGALFAGGVNYGFIYTVGKALMKLDLE